MRLPYEHHALCCYHHAPIVRTPTNHQCAHRTLSLTKLTRSAFMVFGVGVWVFGCLGGTVHLQQAVRAVLFDLNHAPYKLYEVECIDLVSLACLQAASSAGLCPESQYHTYLYAMCCLYCLQAASSAGRVRRARTRSASTPPSAARAGSGLDLGGAGAAVQVQVQAIRARSRSSSLSSLPVTGPSLMARPGITATTCKSKCRNN